MNLITEIEAAEMLNVQVNFLKKDRKNGAKIPFYQLGPKTARYDKDELNAFIEGSRVTKEILEAQKEVKASISKSFLKKCEEMQKAGVAKAG